jgi:hypothetical protein
LLSGDAIVWPDGTRSSSSPHPSVIIGNKSSVKVGAGVFVGQGKGSVPLDDPNAPNMARRAVLLTGVCEACPDPGVDSGRAGKARQNKKLMIPRA